MVASDARAKYEVEANNVLPACSKPAEASSHAFGILRGRSQRCFTRTIGQTDTIGFLERKVGRAPHDLASSKGKKEKENGKKKEKRGKEKQSEML